MEDKNNKTEQTEKQQENKTNVETETTNSTQTAKTNILKGKDKKLKEELNQLTQKNDELKDKYLRLVAEYDNYRKRTLKEKLELRENTKSDILSDFLIIVDDVDRAMYHIENATDIDSTKEGVKLISTKFYDFLNTQGVKEIIAIGDDFNTDLHEAVSRFPVEEEEKKGKVIDVIQKGYTINSKVIRYSKVVVGE